LILGRAFGGRNQADASIGALASLSRKFPPHWIVDIDVSGTFQNLALSAACRCFEAPVLWFKSPLRYPSLRQSSRAHPDESD
jgi:hypothetical protein